MIVLPGMKQRTTGWNDGVMVVKIIFLSHCCFSERWLYLFRSIAKEKGLLLVPEQSNEKSDLLLGSPLYCFRKASLFN